MGLTAFHVAHLAGSGWPEAFMCATWMRGVKPGARHVAHMAMSGDAEVVRCATWITWMRGLALRSASGDRRAG
ncbi:hypothetical protein GCM10025738_27190 [Microbacterium fluvii]